jgi:hypothetical protein
MKFFRVLSGISLFKKKSSLIQVTDALDYCSLIAGYLRTGLKKLPSG